MLEEPASLKIVLPHGRRQGVDWDRNQGVGLAQLSKGQVKGLLVAVQVLVVEIAVFVKPHAKTERRPATLFIHQNLAGFELVFPRRSQP